MTILYSLVARGSVVLAEFSGTPTNATTISRQILEKLPGNNDDLNVSYSQDRYIFHVKRTDGLTVLCMADDVAGNIKSLASNTTRVHIVVFANV
ncbi:vesicle-associated membrane protein [Artemisia annua]|uniref:Vesicle-associated membrane protein n=1 Tax=Artemisia annua TaxID=35608 RepID=A0A2U1M5W1_ARTAN|nr:vesicle-associated membrane protein [Artemisia annua]